MCDPVVMATASTRLKVSRVGPSIYCGHQTHRIYLKNDFSVFMICECRLVHLCAVPVESRRGHQVPRSWSYRQL